VTCHRCGSTGATTGFAAMGSAPVELCASCVAWFAGGGSATLAQARDAMPGCGETHLFLLTSGDAMVCCQMEAGHAGPHLGSARWGGVGEARDEGAGEPWSPPKPGDTIELLLFGRHWIPGTVMATGEALGCGIIQGWAARAEEGKTWRRVAAPDPRPAGDARSESDMLDAGDVSAEEVAAVSRRLHGPEPTQGAGCGRALKFGGYRCGYRTSRDHVVLCDLCRTGTVADSATVGEARADSTEGGPDCWCAMKPYQPHTHGGPATDSPDDDDAVNRHRPGGAGEP
jgi:hypothetical protein